MAPLLNYAQFAHLHPGAQPQHLQQAYHGYMTSHTAQHAPVHGLHPTGPSGTPTAPVGGTYHAPAPVNHQPMSFAQWSHLHPGLNHLEQTQSYQRDVLHKAPITYNHTAPHVTPTANGATGTTGTPPTSGGFTGPNPYLDPSVAANIGNYMGVPGQINPQIATTSADYAAQLAGYSDSPVGQNAVTQATQQMQVGIDGNGNPIYQTPGGITTYTYSMGPDGQLYRQAASGTAESAAQRGVVSGSAIGNAYNTAHQTLDAQKLSILQNAQSAQGNLVGQAQTALQNDSTGVGTALQNWNTQQAQNIQGSATAAQASGQTPKSPMDYKTFVSLHGGTSTTKLANLWRATYGNPNWIGFQ